MNNGHEMNGETPLREVRRWLADMITPTEHTRTGNLKAKPGVECPACTQNVGMMLRPMTDEMARALIAMHLADTPDGWVKVQNMTYPDGSPVVRGGDWTKLKHWGFIEGKEAQRADGNPRNGYWRLTDLGRQFLAGTLSVPRRVHIFNDERHGMDGPLITIRDALDSPFHYAEAMGWQ